MLHTYRMDEKTLMDIKVMFTEPIVIYCDNTSAISFSRNLVQHSKAKHIPIKYHYLREQAANKNIRLEYISTEK